MITLTKEWLMKTIAELEEERDATPGVVNEDAAKALAAMKIALASLEAEPVISHVGSKNALDDIVAFIKSNRNPTLKDHNEVSERLFQDNCHGLSSHVIEYIKQIGEELEELRSTQDAYPPAPVSVPEWTNEQCLEFLSIAFRHAEIKGDLELDDIRLGVKMVNGSRAAMLQGAETVTTAYKLPEGWVAVPVEPTEDMIVNGFESEPDESFSDEKEWEAYEAMSGCQQAAHRAKLCWAAMIAAAPKPEVK